jgi:hypothetical protein
MLGHVSDGFDLVYLAVSDLENMRGRKVKRAVIILPLGYARHASDFHDFRVPIMDKYGLGKDQFHFLIDCKYAPAVDIRNIAHNACAELIAAGHPSED